MAKLMYTEDIDSKERGVSREVEAKSLEELLGKAVGAWETGEADQSLSEVSKCEILYPSTCRLIKDIEAKLMDIKSKYGEPAVMWILLSHLWPKA